MCVINLFCAVAHSSFCLFDTVKLMFGRPMRELDIHALSPGVADLDKRLREKVIGQDRAIKHIIKSYVPMTVGLHRDGRPLGVFLFLGPTGTGKTLTVRVFAEMLLGNRNAVTRIDCAEYGESHEVAKLLGSPPGYIGYNDKPRLCQEAIDEHQTKDAKLNIVLFDEIEKADNRLFDAIMTILGDGRLTLGNGKVIDFTKTFIFLTSNLGSQEVHTMILGRGIGFSPNDKERADMDEKIYRISKEAVKKKFRPEFVNRLDSTIVFHSLSRESLKRILKIELEDLQWRIWKSPYKDYKFESDAKVPESLSIVFRCTENAMEFLLDEGTSELYGARELNRTVDRYVTYPMATLIASQQTGSGDKVKIDHIKGDKDLTFTKVGTL